jgi:hypothetical protein
MLFRRKHDDEIVPKFPIEDTVPPGPPLGQPPFGRRPVSPIAIAPHAESELRRLIGEGKKIHAIKLVREQTGLGLRDAKDLVEAMEAGRPVTVPQDTVQLSLADQVRSLHATGDRTAAINLICSQTGMNATEADRFITALDLF